MLDDKFHKSRQNFAQIAQQDQQFRNQVRDELTKHEQIANAAIQSKQPKNTPKWTQSREVQQNVLQYHKAKQQYAQELEHFKKQVAREDFSQSKKEKFIQALVRSRSTIQCAARDNKGYRVIPPLKYARSRSTSVQDEFLARQQLDWARSSVEMHAAIEK